MTTFVTSLDVLMLTFALPNCAVAVVALPWDTGLEVRLHDGTTFTIPPNDLPRDGDSVATGHAIYQACLARQRQPVG